VGATALDITAKASVTTSDTPSTFPGKVTTSLGGVARNLAEAAHRVFRSPYDTLLVSAVGKSDDVFGAVIRRKLDGLGMRTDGLVDSSTGSGVCNMLLDDQGSLIGGVADFAALDAFQASDVGMILVAVPDIF
jgi:pseudouridine-5'-phosphate glycosidase/pseudouridine kinase